MSKAFIRRVPIGLSEAKVTPPEIIPPRTGIALAMPLAKVSFASFAPKNFRIDLITGL